MTVNKLIKLLEKMPGKAQIAVDVSYAGKKDWVYEKIDLTPTLHEQVEMHEDFVTRGVARYQDMCVLGTIVGDYLE